jgi:hypothetical protein
LPTSGFERGVIFSATSEKNENEKKNSCIQASNGHIYPLPGPALNGGKKLWSSSILINKSDLFVTPISNDSKICCASKQLSEKAEK